MWHFVAPTGPGTMRLTKESLKFRIINPDKDLSGTLQEEESQVRAYRGQYQQGRIVVWLRVVLAIFEELNFRSVITVE